MSVNLQQRGKRADPNSNIHLVKFKLTFPLHEGKQVKYFSCSNYLSYENLGVIMKERIKNLLLDLRHHVDKAYSTLTVFPAEVLDTPHPQKGMSMV